MMDATCPNCGTTHLHVDVLMNADAPGCWFEGAGVAADGVVRLKTNAGGFLQVKEAWVSCCACDWSESRPFITESN